MSKEIRIIIAVPAPQPEEPVLEYAERAVVPMTPEPGLQTLISAYSQLAQINAAAELAICGLGDKTRIGEVLISEIADGARMRYADLQPQIPTKEDLVRETAKMANGESSPLDIFTNALSAIKLQPEAANAAIVVLHDSAAYLRGSEQQQRADLYSQKETDLRRSSFIRFLRRFNSDAIDTEIHETARKFANDRPLLVTTVAESVEALVDRTGLREEGVVPQTEVIAQLILHVLAEQGIFPQVVAGAIDFAIRNYFYPEGMLPEQE